jgi:hypothetical protein
VLALVMVLGTFTMAFADMTDAEMEAGALLEDLGVLEGDGEGNLYLDVELKRQDAVVLLSRLMDQEEIAKNFPVEDEMYSDVEDSFYFGYLAWAKADGTFEGKGTGEFGFDDVIDAKSYAKVLLTALGYEQDVDFEYEEVLEFANEKGIVAVDENGNVTRGTMAVMTVEALAVEMKDGSMTLAEKLEITMPEEPVVEATKVESVYAENLKEVVVVFDGEVDEMTAELEFNYDLDSNLTFSKVELSEDMTMVTLTLQNGDVLDNQEEYELTVRGVKAGDTTLATQKVKFTALDNTLPTVASVSSLGTKAIRVEMSEPIQDIVENRSTNNFKLNGKPFFGSVRIEGRVIILRAFNEFTVGTNELTVSGLKDFEQFKTLSQTISFEVVEDTKAPVIVETSATLEKVELVFDEEIDPNTVTKSNFYWKSGNTKITPDTYEIDGTKITLEFAEGDELPAVATNFYVINLADYSGNKMAETEVVVTPVIDQTRPEVVYAKVEDNNTDITVKFNKTLELASAQKISNYEVKDNDDDTVSIKDVQLVNSNTVEITLYEGLAAGVNTLKISGVRDRTTLNNVMLPFTVELNTEDKDAPEIGSVTLNDTNRTIFVNFDKEMDLASIGDSSNYLLTVDGVQRTLPAGTSITPVQNGKSVMIILPSKISNKTVVFTSTGNTNETYVSAIAVLAVRDVAGNLLKTSDYGTTQALSETSASLKKYSSSVGADVYAELVDQQTVKVRFDRVISNVTDSSIIVGGESGRIVANNSEFVTIELNEKIGTDVPATVSFSAGQLQDIAGIDVPATTLNGVNIKDSVKPEVDLVSGDKLATVSGSVYQIEVPFSEDLKTIVSGITDEALARDFEVVRVNGNKTLKAGIDYTATIVGDTVVITITANATPIDSYYEVRVKDASFLVDNTLYINKAADSDWFRTAIQITR